MSFCFELNLYLIRKHVFMRSNHAFDLPISIFLTPTLSSLPKDFNSTETVSFRQSSMKDNVKYHGKVIKVALNRHEF